MSAPVVANFQYQSPLFTTLPLETRRDVYKQLWLDYGLTQHIFALNSDSCLLSYPCLLSSEQLDRDPGSDPTTPTATADAGDGPDDPNDAADADATAEAEQPQPQDDLGDINDALQDLSIVEPEQPKNGPWCAHFACFRNCSQKWKYWFSIYSALSRRTRPDLRNSAVLTTFLVCRRMYQEASEHLFSNMRFSFSSMAAMERFLSEVPRALTSRVQSVHINSSDVDRIISGFYPPDYSAAQDVHDKVKASFPKLRELRLTLHSPHLSASKPIPQKQDLEPLYALARELDNLRKFEVFLPTMCGVGSQVGYGDAPNSLQDAPFTVKVVPLGWHEVDSECCLFFSSL